MKNVFNKTNAPYLVSGALAVGTLLTSGIFAIAPYVGFLAPVAALSLGLPFIVGGAIFSAVVIALSSVAISKNNTNTISQQEKFESRVAQRKEEEAKARAELKAEGKLPDVIALPYKDLEISSSENQPAKEENGQSWGAWAWEKVSSRCPRLCGQKI